MKGWGWPHCSPSAHYYIEHQSLCMTSAFFEDDLENYDHTSPDNCWVCMRELFKFKKEKRKKKNYINKGPLTVTLGELVQHKGV